MFGFGLGICRQRQPLAWAHTVVDVQTFLAGNVSDDNPHSLGAMSSPPTITTSSSDLTATYAEYLQFDGTGTVGEDIALIEGGFPEIVDTSFVRPFTAQRDETTHQTVTSRISVSVNADVVAFLVSGTTLPYRFLVDDQYVDFTGTVPAVTSGTGDNYIILTFASKAVRKVTIELQSEQVNLTEQQAIKRISVKASDSFGAKPTSSAVSMIAFGDSFCWHRGATHLGDGYVTVLGDGLGISNAIASGLGGTGFISGRGGDVYNNLQGRVVGDLQSFQSAFGAKPSVIVVEMGSNDSSYTLQELEAAAGATYDLIRVECPAALVFVVGLPDSFAPSAPPSLYDDLVDAIKAPMETRNGFYFVDMKGVPYTKSDAVHPDTAGHSTLGDHIASEIRTIVAAQ